MYLFIYSSLHVSSMSCSSSGETNCINTACGNCHSVLVAVSCAGWEFTPTQHTTLFKTWFFKVKVVPCTIMTQMCVGQWKQRFFGNCPTWCTNSFQCIYLFIVLYMFWACHAHHQEKQIVSIQLLVTVTPCWWQCRVLVGSGSYQKLYWYNLFLLMMSMTCSKQVREL